MTIQQMNSLWVIPGSDIFPDGATDKEIDDFFAYERETIANQLGYDSWEDIECQFDVENQDPYAMTNNLEYIWWDEEEE